VEHQTAITNIRKRQVQQKKDQNKAHRITDDPVPIGTQVFVSTTGINDKLYPKYRGPFKVVSRTENGNYIIENLLHERVQGTFPLQRLKIVKGKKKDENEYYRIEKIIDDRKVNGKTEVLIKWKGYSAKHNTWELLENLTDKDMYTKYLKSKEKKKTKEKQNTNETTKRKASKSATRSTVKKTKLSVSNLIMSLICILLFLPLMFAQSIHTINTPSYFCEHPGDSPWNLPILLTEKGCSDWKIEAHTNKSILDNSKNKKLAFGILSKQAFEIRGIAYECRKKKIKLQSSENFFGARFTERAEEIVIMTEEECRQLVITKRCGENEMNCVKDEDRTNCEFTPTLNEKFEWLSTHYEEGVQQ